jgi:hypothetical protein
MSREIKFRYNYTNGARSFFQIFTLDEICNGDPFEVLSDQPLLRSYKMDGDPDQFTGLTDKNEMPIFEGDIVGGVLYKDYSEHTGRILYDFNGYRILTKDKSLPLDLPEKLKVIGNIHQDNHLLHENPELLNTTPKFKGGENEQL